MDSKESDKTSQRFEECGHTNQSSNCGYQLTGEGCVTQIEHSKCGLGTTRMHFREYQYLARARLDLFDMEEKNDINLLSKQSNVNDGVRARHHNHHISQHPHTRARDSFLPCLHRQKERCAMSSCVFLFFLFFFVHLDESANGTTRQLAEATGVLLDQLLRTQSVYEMGKHTHTHSLPRPAQLARARQR